MVPVKTPTAGYDPTSPHPPRRPSGPATIWRFLRWMLQTDPSRTAQVVGLEIARGLVPAGVVWVVSRAFATAVGVARGTAPLQALLGWLAVWSVLAVVETAGWPLLDLLLERLRQEMEDALQLELQRKAGALRLEVFERADFYDILSRAREAAAPGAFLLLLRILLEVPRAAATVAALAWVIGSWSPWLLATTIVAALPNPMAEIVLQRATYFLTRRQTPHLRLRDYLARVLTSREAAKEVRTYHLGSWLLRRWRELYWSVADEQYRQTRAQGLASGALRSLGAFGVGGGLAFAAWALVRGALSAGRFAAMLAALQGLQEATWTMVHSFGQGAGDRVLKIADLFVYLDLGPEEPQGGIPAEEIGDIVLEAVSFRYPQRAEPTLRDITCIIRAGERVALVGANGAGKTTLVKVLTGLYRPTAGRVLYGGRDLATLDLAALRDRQAAVFQDHVHYAYALGENVGYGRAELLGDREAVVAAAVRGGADAVAEALPEGYDTLLTRQFSGGTELSGGQWQRVAVSRGFMRDAPLIVLDEPTASLDPKAEADVFRRFAAVAGGRTALLVSHRLGSARLCDRVLVLREGCLVEQGTHEALLAAGGEYARMWALQSQWYL